MTRRPRPHFALTDLPLLLEALGEARKWVIRRRSAERFGSELYFDPAALGEGV